MELKRSDSDLDKIKKIIAMSCVGERCEDYEDSVLSLVEAVAIEAQEKLLFLLFSVSPNV